MQRPRLFLALLALLAVSCAASDAYYAGTDQMLARQEYAAALQQIESAGSNGYKRQDRLLFLLDAGMLAHYAGKYQLSNFYLSEADRVMAENYAKSVSQAIGSFLYNDTVTDYSGEDYELIYLHLAMALNYLNMEQYSSARVETRRMNEELAFLKTKYKKQTADLLASEDFSNSDILNKMPQGESRFYASAAASYLSLLLYAAQGRIDDMRIDRNAVLEAFQTQKNLYPFKAPLDLLALQMQLPRQGFGRLNVFSFTGRSPRKTEKTARLFLGPAYFKASYPALSKGVGQAAAIKVTAGPYSFYLSPLEEMSLTAQDTFKAKASAIYLKASLRALAKSGAALAATSAAKEQSDLGGLAAWLAGVLYSEASERADLRLSRFFPGRLSVGAIDLPAGQYPLAVYYYDQAGHVLSIEKRDPVKIEDGLYSFIESNLLQ